MMDKKQEYEQLVDQKWNDGSLISGHYKNGNYMVLSRDRDGYLEIQTNDMIVVEAKSTLINRL